MTSPGSSSSNTGTEGTRKRFSVRFHLVRHGETNANRDGIVLGQIDSPLTPLGISQAKAFHRKFGRNHEVFFRKESSDLGRCRHTSRLVLGIGGDDGEDRPQTNAAENEIKLTLDVRLRERAKGVREGMSKKLTYEQAMEIYTRKNCNTFNNTFEANMPLLESEEEVLRRTTDWMQDILGDAHAHAHAHAPCYDDQDILNEEAQRQQYDILAVTHSGFLRILIENLVGTQLPKDVKREESTSTCSPNATTSSTYKSSETLGRLIVPNTSKTIIAFHLLANENDVGDEDVTIISTKHHETGQKIYWRVELVDLLNITHLEGNEPFDASN